MARRRVPQLGLRHRPTSHAAIDPRRFGDAPSNRSAQHRAVLRACRRARRLPVRWHSDACRDKRARRYRLWQQIVMTEKRQYSKAEKAAWGAEQDRIRAAGGIKAGARSKVLQADTGKATEPGEAADRRHF